nr:MAG TPA: hypothetical protein [Caudoviricetes sp.]
MNNNNCTNTNGARPALVEQVRPSKRKPKAVPPPSKRTISRPERANT